MPGDLSLESVRSSLQTMSDLVSPTPLGLHSNSSMARDSGESRRLLEASLATQPQVEVGGQLESGVTVQDEVSRLLDKVPELINDTDLETKYPLTYDQSLNTVLQLEVTRYNDLIRIVRQNLADLQVMRQESLTNTKISLFRELSKVTSSCLWRLRTLWTR